MGWGQGVKLGGKRGGLGVMEEGLGGSDGVLGGREGDFGGKEERLTGKMFSCANDTTPGCQLLAT